MHEDLAFILNEFQARFHWCGRDLDPFVAAVASLARSGFGLRFGLEDATQSSS